MTIHGTFFSFLVILLRAQREMQRDVERSQRCRVMVFGIKVNTRNQGRHQRHGTSDNDFVLLGRNTGLSIQTTVSPRP